jgi:hypothetical protein
MLLTDHHLEMMAVKGHSETPKQQVKQLKEAEVVAVPEKEVDVEEHDLSVVAYLLARPQRIVMSSRLLLLKELPSMRPTSQQQPALALEQRTEMGHPVIAVAAVPLVDDAASALASAFAFRDFGESPHEPDRIQDTARPCIDDNEKEHTANSHNAGLNTSGSCTRQCASIVSSFPHSVVSQDSDRPRADTSLHDVTVVDAVVDALTLAVDQTPAVVHRLLEEQRLLAVRKLLAVAVIVAVAGVEN